MEVANSHHSTGKIVITRQLSRTLPCFEATPILLKWVLIAMQVRLDLVIRVVNQQNSGLRLNAFSTRIQQIWIRRLECTQPSTSSLLWTKGIKRQGKLLRQPTKHKLRASRNWLAGIELRIVLSKGQASQHSPLSNQVLKERNSVEKTRYVKFEPLLIHPVWLVGRDSCLNQSDFARFHPSVINPNSKIRIRIVISVCETFWNQGFNSEFCSPHLISLIFFIF